MLSNRKINLRSLHVIRDQLMITIEQTATQLESYVTDRENINLLNACISSLQQIRGSLDLIELSGARELAGELVHTAQKIMENGTSFDDEKLSALTKGFFVLSCYFEYALQKEWGMPALIVPYINDIRISNSQPIVGESYFVENAKNFTLPKKNEVSATLPDGETMMALAKRCRQMYQVGLLGFMRGIRVNISLELMKRALRKIEVYSRDQPNHTFWWLACNVIDVFLKQKMVVTLERKRLFSHFDKEFKRIEKEGRDGFWHVTDPQHTTEMAYYIALASIQSKPFTSIVRAYGLDDLGYTEQCRIKELAVLTGPSAGTVRSVVDSLRNELVAAKEVIENIAASESVMIEGNENFMVSVTKIRDILGVIGLTSAAETMKQQLEQLATWRQSGAEPDTKQLMSIADTLLYVESVLDCVINSNFSSDKLAEINSQSRSAIVFSNHLAGAQLVVIDEVEAGLSLTQRALCSFSESSYDRVHLMNIPKVMNSVRGGMIVLELPRAADVVASSIDFIEGCLLSNKPIATVAQKLETFADTIVCLEYYLDCVKLDKHVSTDTLLIAEESLAALGHGVARCID